MKIFRTILRFVKNVKNAKRFSAGAGLSVQTSVSVQDLRFPASSQPLFQQASLIVWYLRPAPGELGEDNQFISHIP